MVSLAVKVGVKIIGVKGNEVDLCLNILDTFITVIQPVLVSHPEHLGQSSKKCKII